MNKMSRRERIGSRYITRRKDGTFSKNVDIGRSLSADRRRKAKTQVKSGQGRGDKGDIKRAEDKHPKLSAKAKSVYVFPKRQAYPIGDLKHGKYALIYSTWPDNKKDAAKVRAAVFKRYPQLRKWFEGGKYEKKDVPDEYNAEAFDAQYVIVHGEDGRKKAHKTGFEERDGFTPRFIERTRTEQLGDYVPSDSAIDNVAFENHAETFDAEINYDAKIKLNRAKDAQYITPSIEEGMAFEDGEGVLQSSYSVVSEAEEFGAEASCGNCGNALVMNAEGEHGCGCGTKMSAETFEARTYRRTPARRKGERKSKRDGKMRRFRKLQSARKSMAAQGYDDKLDESMGMRDGDESTKEQSMKDRRDESKGTEKAMGDRAYSGVKSMDIGERRIPRGFAPKMHYITQKELQEEARKNRNMKDAEEFSAEDWYGWRVKDVINYLSGYDENMPIVVRSGIGWSGFANYTPEIGLLNILPDGSDDYDSQRKEMAEGKLSSIEAVAIGRDGYGDVEAEFYHHPSYDAEAFDAEINYDAKIKLNRAKDAQYITPSIEEGMAFEDGEGFISSNYTVVSEAEEFEAYGENIVEDVKHFDVVGTAQDVVGKTGVNIPTGVASLAVLWVAYMTGKKYGN